MFVHYYTDVAVPLNVVESRIDDVRGHLEDLGDVVYRDGEDLYTRVGPEGIHFAKKVRLEIGVPDIRHAGLVYPVAWSAAGAGALFPRLTADLVVSHMGREKTRLSLQGTYKPPFGPIGRAVDRSILRSVAESTVQDWVDRVASAISSGQPVS